MQGRKGFAAQRACAGEALEAVSRLGGEFPGPLYRMLSIPHLIVIFLVALVVLGPEKLPQVARVLGKTMADFRRITNDFRSQIDDEMRDLERQAREREIATALAPVQPPPTEFSELPPAPPAEHAELVEPHAEVPPAEKPADGEPHPA